MRKIQIFDFRSILGFGQKLNIWIFRNNFFRYHYRKIPNFLKNFFRFFAKKIFHDFFKIWKKSFPKNHQKSTKNRARSKRKNFGKKISPPHLKSHKKIRFFWACNLRKKSPKNRVVWKQKNFGKKFSPPHRKRI